MSTPTRILLKILFIGALCVSTFSNHVSASTFITEDIIEDTTWSKAMGDIVIEFPIAVFEGATLTILPGTVVKFNYQTDFYIGGTLIAEGTSDNPIYFSNLDDDSVGTDALNDGPHEVYMDSSYWWNMIFEDTGGDSIINNAVIRYPNTLFTVYDANLSVSNTSVDFFGSVGVLLGSDSVLDIKKMTVTNHVEDIYDFNFMFGVYDDASLILSNATIGPYYGFLIDIVNNASAVVKHTTFAGTLENDFSLFPDGVLAFENSNLVMINTTFSDVSGEVLYLDSSSASILDSVFLNNNTVIGTFNEALLSLDNSVLYGFPDAGIIDYGTSISPQNILSIHDNYIVGDTVTSTGLEFYAEEDTEESYTDISNNAIYFNEFGAYNYTYNGLEPVMEDNWWGSATGPYNSSQNEDGEGNEVSGDINFTPYLSENPLPPFGTPKVFQFTQYKRDGAFIVPEGETLVSDTVSYGATVQSFLFNAMLEVELKSAGDPFNGSNTLLSTPVTNNQKAVVVIPDLSDGEYHVRYRVKTNNGLESPWQEFGVVGNTDLVVHQVPHYTQVQALGTQYENVWFDDQLANNTGDCATIELCGCALASTSMILKYYGQTIDGEEPTPANLNTWLKNNKGYASGGVIKFDKIEDLTNEDIKFNPGIIYGQNNSELNSHLGNNQIGILNVAGNGGGDTHFVTVTNQLANNNYEINDPTNYLTETLDDISGPHIRDFNKKFAGLRLFSYDPEHLLPTFDPYTSYTIGSPAELVVTNSLGQRTGKNPITGEEFNEIPDSEYYVEGYASGSESDEEPEHLPKGVYIFNPSDENYTVTIYGTDEGEYSFQGYVDDNVNESELNSGGETFNGGITNFNSSVGVNEETIVTLSPGIDTQSPKADIYLDALNWSTIVDGLDTGGEPLLTQNNNSYTFTDLSSNTTSFSLNPTVQTSLQKKYNFSNFSQNGQVITIPITRLEYTRQLGQQNTLKKLIQKITIQGVVTIEAVYNKSVDKTVITKTYPDPIVGPVTTEIFDGVKIIHLTAVNGELGYEW